MNLKQQSRPESSKNPYETPRLKIYGNIDVLTQTNGSSLNSDDGSKGSGHKTH